MLHWFWVFRLWLLVFVKVKVSKHNVSNKFTQKQWANVNNKERTQISVTNYLLSLTLKVLHLKFVHQWNWFEKVGKNSYYILHIPKSVRIKLHSLMSLSSGLTNRWRSTSCSIRTICNCMHVHNIFFICICIHFQFVHNHAFGWFIYIYIYIYIYLNLSCIIYVYNI